MQHMKDCPAHDPTRCELCHSDDRPVVAAGAGYLLTPEWA